MHRSWRGHARVRISECALLARARRYPSVGQSEKKHEAGRTLKWIGFPPAPRKIQEKGKTLVD
eukprot:517122-Pyramimonas_sp.AAC.1